MMKTYFIFFLFLFLRPTEGVTQSFSIVDLSGEARFAVGDIPEWKKPDFDDSAWQKVLIPGAIENQGFHQFDGMGWYRIRFTLPSTLPEGTLTLHLGRIDDVDQTFLNGKLLGQYGRMSVSYSSAKYVSAYYRFRTYSIPREWLSLGEVNVISVRLYDHELSGGIVEGPLFLELHTEKKPVIDLTGEWKFAPGDEPNRKLPDYKDNHWRSLHVPLLWDAQGFEGYDGWAWYRTKFYVPENIPTDRLYFEAGKIDDASEIYINGILIGKLGTFPPHFQTAYTTQGNFPIVQDVLRPGEMNTVAIRVFDDFLEGGIYEGPVGIFEYSTQGENDLLKSNNVPEFTLDLLLDWVWISFKDWFFSWFK